MKNPVDLMTARIRKNCNTIKNSINFAKDTFNNTVDMYAENGSDFIGNKYPNVFKAAAKAYKDNRE